MNKLLTKVAKLALGLSLAAGVGVAVGSQKASRADAAEQSVTFTLTGSTNRTTISTSLIKYESNNVSFSIIKGSGTNVNNYCPGGATNNTTQTRIYNNNSVEFVAPSNKVITKVDITATSSSYFGGLDTVANYTPTGTKSGSGSTATISFATAVQSRTVTANTTATGRLTAVKIYYDDPSAEATLAINKASITVANGYDATFTVTTANLTANFSVSGGNETYFSTSYTASSADGDHVVSLHGNKATTSPITLTVSSTGATSQTIDVSVEDPSLYEKVTAASEIKAGREIIIGTADGTSLLGKFISGNNCPALANEPNGSGDLISTYLPDGYALLTIGGSSGAWTLTDQDDKIYYGVSGENNLKSSTTATDTWSISVASSGVATITSAASSRSIKRNSSSALFNTYASGQTDVCIYMVPPTDPEVEVSVTGSQSLGIGETATLTATKLNGASGTVGWATSNSSILSISASTGDSITVTAGSTTGSATITTSLIGCDDVETVFTVRRGSATEPYTVAQARDAIDGSDSGAKTGVYTSGIVSQVSTLNSDNSITYYISDNGTTTNQMEVYKGFGLSSATFSSVDDLQVGDEVVVYGNLTKYSTTYEYAAGSYLYSFNRPVVALASITSISGTLSANSGDASWDLSGLTVMGTMSGSATEVDVTAHVNLTTEDVPGSPASTTVRNVSVTATGKDDSTITLTQNVSGTITVLSGPLKNGGRYYIIATFTNDVEYGLNAVAYSSSHPLAIDLSVSNQLTAFDVTITAADTYEITTTISGTKYYLVNNSIATSSNNDNMRVTSSPLNTLASKSWTLEALTGEDEGLYHVKQNTTGSTYRYLSLYNGADWRGYLNTNNGVPKIKFVEEGSYAETIANSLLNDLTCNNGATAPSTSVWGDISDAYSLMTIAHEKALLTGGTADEDSEDTVEQALAKYDYVVGKYLKGQGLTAYNDFLGRDPAQIGGARVLLSNLSSENNNTIAIIVIISLVSVTAIGGYFFIKRREEN